MLPEHDYRIQNFRQVAIESCHIRGLPPFQFVPTLSAQSGTLESVPQWVFEANDIHTLQVRLALLRQSGLL